MDNHDFTVVKRCVATNLPPSKCPLCAKDLLFMANRREQLGLLPTTTAEKAKGSK